MAQSPSEAAFHISVFKSEQSFDEACSDRFCTVRAVELDEQCFDVGLDRVLTDAEHFGDVLIGQAAAHKF